MENEYYVLKDLEKILHLTRRTLFTYIKQGKLIAHKVGNKYLVEKGEVEKLVKGK